MLSEVRDEFLRHLMAGNSPQVICKNLQIDEADYFAAMSRDAAFAEAVERARKLKSQNVEAALYKQALEGNPSAMSQYLKLAPPPEWQGGNEDDANDMMRMTLAELRDATESLRAIAGRVASGEPSLADVPSANSPAEPDVLSESDSTAGE